MDALHIYWNAVWRDVQVRQYGDAQVKAEPEPAALEETADSRLESFRAQRQRKYRLGIDSTLRLIARVAGRL